MKLLFFFAFIFLGTFSLSGCTTEEMRKEKSGESGLVFDTEKTTKESVPPQEAPAQKKPKEAPPVQSPTNTLTQKKMYTTQPSMTIDVTKKYTATLKTTVGMIEVELDAEATPITVNNFVFLAREKFYDGTVFHRTIKDFMIQGGDPTGTGMGGPGYKFADESFSGEYTRGTIAMANSGSNTNGSQFFIMHKDTPLPKNYVIFGKVTTGLETVDIIAGAPTRKEGEGSSPVTPVVIETMTVVEK